MKMNLSLRQKIQLSLAMFTVSAVMVAGGVYLDSVAVTSGGLLVFLAAVLTALFWWRCPYCGKGFDPPFNKKNCVRCGREIDYEMRKKHY